MDLSTSPDLDVRFCYAIVVLLGVIVAVRQFGTRFPDFVGWRFPETWVVFLCYVGVPVLLFWYFDRIKAISDTSLFAAVLIGLGYERILSGKLDPLPVIPDASKLWQPFIAWSNRVADLAVAYREKLRRKHVDPDKLRQLVPRVLPLVILWALAFTALLGSAAYLAYQHQPTYFAWRLRKPATSAADVARTRRSIARRLADKTTAKPMEQALLWEFDSPNLPSARLDEIVALLLQFRKSMPDLQSSLVDLLRTSNADVRARAQQALLFLRKEDGGAKLPPELESWKPSTSDTNMAIEGYITMWKET
ncbi:MAG TPA: hypothetical protein VNH11_18890 [Pirellulales bacterium]|nr:hypothetical protein [Pirellulales bacterium]